MKVHYFQRYHFKEDVSTANAMLLLSRLYTYSPEKFYHLLKMMFIQDPFDPEISFDMQKYNGASRPDAVISQPAFKIVVETKLSDWFYSDQLIRHLESFKNEDYNSTIEEIMSIIKEYNITKIILGLPKNMNNTLGERAETTLKYKELLEKNTDIPIVMFDERLTSVISNNILIEADMSRKKRKKKVDSIAAQIILQDYLNKEKNNG